MFYPSRFFRSNLSTFWTTVKPSIFFLQGFSPCSPEILLLQTLLPVQAAPSFWVEPIELSLSRGRIYCFGGYVQGFLVGAGVLGIGLKRLALVAKAGR
jgi:hypothetical protein